MLQAIRGRAASWIVKILFVMLILSFVAWGVADWVNSAARPQVVAEIGPVRVDPNTFSQAVTNEMQRFRQMFGANFDREQAKQFGIGDRVIEQIIAKTLVELEAKRLGLTISDQVLRDAIRNNPSFKNERGEFDRYRFEAIINRAGYSEARFLEDFLRDLQRSQLVRPIADGATPAKALTEALLRYRGERRAADTYLVATAAVGALPAPTDAQLEDYLKANSSRFMRPEYRTLSVLVLSPDQLTARITVSDADAKKAYQERLDEFTTPEQRTVEQMQLPDEAAAQKAADEIAGGKTFEAVATALGKSDADIKFGDVKRDDLPAEFATPIFELALDATSKPVKSGFGWHLFKVTAITAERVQPFESIQAKLIEELKREQAADQLPQLANKLEDALAGGAALDEAAAKVDLTVIKTAAVDQRGRGTDEKPLADLPQVAQLLPTAFGLAAAGQTSRLVETGDDSYVAVRVNEITAAVLPPLAEIKDAVVVAWSQAQRDDAAKKKAEALVEKVKGGAAIDKAAAELGATLKPSTPFTRDGAGAQLPSGLPSQLFAGPVGTVAMGQTSEGYLVARLKEILPVDPVGAEAQLTKLQGELKQTMGNDLLQQFEAGLRSRFSVSVNQKAVDQAM
jgi:peptidyl-prolyl cis-trans isomerase D